MRAVRDGLGLILLICVIVKVSAWLVTPVLPLLVTLFAMLTVYVVILGGRRGR